SIVSTAMLAKTFLHWLRLLQMQVCTIRCATRLKTTDGVISRYRCGFERCRFHVESGHIFTSVRLGRFVPSTATQVQTLNKRSTTSSMNLPMLSQAAPSAPAL